MDNPFRPTKFEWEKRPVIWLSARAKALATSIKPVFISGSRGSGKTTILRSLSTRQIAGDSLLRSQFGSRKLGWYGQYLQFNNTLQERTDRVIEFLNVNDDIDETSERVFCAYFEISLLLNFFNDLIHFQDSDFLHFRSKVEANACAELSSIVSTVRWSTDKKLDNFQDARRLAREFQNEFLKSESQFDVEGAREAINAFAPGTIIRFIKEFAISAIQSSNFSFESLDFYILLDDCETLSERQQIALNTYIRRTEGVAKWVICYLSDRYNSTETVIRNTSLTADDRDLIKLNEMGEKDFSEFCEQVVNLRLTKFIEGLGRQHVSGKHVAFDLDMAFGGGTPYNRLIEEIIKGSEKRSLDVFKKEVNVTKGALAHHINASNHRRFSCTKTQTPYIEHLVISAMGLKLGDYPLPEEQLSLSKTIDGKQAAAYIAFCAKFGVRPIYSGSNFIRSISDRCIRDFLDTMSVFFDQFLGAQRVVGPSKASLLRSATSFLKDTSIPFKRQDDAIREVSRLKFQNLQQLRNSEPEIERLVLSIARLQQQFEHDFENWVAVRSPTRGKYVVELPDGMEASSGTYSIYNIRDVLSRLEYDRYIKIIKLTKNVSSVEVRFSLHRRLRPYFNCGHSGPYDPLVPISPTWILEALNGDDNFDPQKWAEERYERISKSIMLGAPDQIELPL